MVAFSKKGEGVNPQEATVPEGHHDGDSCQETPKRSQDNSGNEKSPSPTREAPMTSSCQTGRNHPMKQQPNGTKKPKKKRRKKRNRVAYVASVQDESTNDEFKEPPSIPLPLNHYQTVLVRRAIRKRETGGQQSPGRGPPSPKSQANEADDEEVYGDISLGMKLSVVGGKVMVQNLNPLSDGRASPAQLVGVIHRGDVLLSINNLSLVNLPIDLLMERLKPLSTPDSLGAYQRILHLRMGAGEGLELLRKYEAAEARKTYAAGEAATEVFSLFPMVDQLSGMPLFDNSIASPSVPAVPQQRPHQHEEEKKQIEEDPSALSIPLESEKEESASNLVPSEAEKSMDDIISSQVAQWRSMERKTFTSEFFAWNDNFSELLRPSEGLATVPIETTEKTMTKSEMLELGRKAVLGAEKLCRRMEEIDRGKDMRSFRSWNSSISLRSRASTRRKFVLDAVSLPVSLGIRANPRGGQEGGSLMSEASEKSDMEEVDGDALLLRLAAHDEIWRSQVIECLQDARDKLENGDSDESDNESKEEEVVANSGIDSVMTKELGAFLFGETMAKIITKKKKSKALPPSEITAVLFDLSTNLASTMPDEVGVGDGTASGLLKSSLVPFLGRTRPEAGSSVILATRFVLDEALAVWLGTFRPLPWESRRVLWPYTKHSPNAGDTHNPSMFSDADSLTLDSGQLSPKSSHTGSTGGNRKQTRDLRQQIEDQELDVETRAETCFLVTYYFTQRLLPKVASSPIGGSGSGSAELIEFVKTYGAYMKLHTCLAYAAALKFPDVINKLIELAQHDLRHKEIIKLFTRRNALILYEPTMLSAIVECLPRIREESSADRRQQLVDICVSAYPDLCPWQVKHALLKAIPVGVGEGVRSNLKDLYYYYLSNLLHPQDGHDAARKDSTLVEEWCILSLEESTSSKTAKSGERRKNFFRVASRNSSDHLGYKRDLVMLLKLSMASHEHDLALDLVGEIVDNPALSRDFSVLSLVLQYLREITQSALDKGENVMLPTLRRAIRLLHQMAVTLRPSQSDEQVLSVPEELCNFLEYKERTCDASKESKRELLDLIHFLADEANPSDFLEAFSRWTETHELRFDALTVLQGVLRRGTRSALLTELSGSLLRLRRARRQMETNKHFEAKAAQMQDRDTLMTEPTLWSLMSKGLVAVDK